MKWLPTVVTLHCLFQVGFVVFGTLFTRLFLNIGLRHSETAAATLPHKATVAWFIRSHGAWFLLAPLLCSIWAAAKATSNQGEPELDDRNSGIIFLSTFVLGILFVFSAVSPWSYMFRD